MMNRRIGLLVSIFSLYFLVWAMPSLAVVNVQAEVDACDLSRGLLKASCVYPVRAGTCSLNYPKWLEGVHGPTSPVQNLAEIAVFTLEGERIPWRRDPLEVTHFLIDVPQGVQKIVVKTTYICNQPTAGSMGVDSHGTSLLGIICWNTCLLYPEGQDISDVVFDLQLKLPPDWQWGSSLTSTS